MKLNWQFKDSKIFNERIKPDCIKVNKIYNQIYEIILNRDSTSEFKNDNSSSSEIKVI